MLAAGWPRALAVWTVGFFVMALGVILVVFFGAAAFLTAGFFDAGVFLGAAFFGAASFLAVGFLGAAFFLMTLAVGFGAGSEAFLMPAVFAARGRRVRVEGAAFFLAGLLTFGGILRVAWVCEDMK